MSSYHTLVDIHLHLEHLHESNIHCKARIQPYTPEKGTPNSARQEGESHRGYVIQGMIAVQAAPTPSPSILRSLTVPFPVSRDPFWPQGRNSFENSAQRPTLLKLFLTSSSIKTPAVGPPHPTSTSESEMLQRTYLHTQLFYWPPSLSETGMMSSPMSSTMEVTKQLGYWAGGKISNC